MSELAQHPHPLATSARAAQLEAMAARPLDVLVVGGGGVTGVGVALDAAARGLRVGIVERDDWACGTSSRSSKMIHGGLRYLATGDVGVVRESLRERTRLQRNAAHLVRPLPMLLPVYGSAPVPFQRLKLAAGLWAYEALGHRRAAGSFHRWIGVEELTRLVPGVALQSREGGGRLRGAQAYHDGCADDVRLVLAVLRTAVAHGALAANGADVTRLLREGSRVVGVAVDSDVGSFELEAAVVVNATGVWADATLTDEGAAPPSFRVLPSKGIHLTVRRDRAGIDSGIAFFGQTDNSNVFLEPWQDDLAFVGTTDAPYDGADLRDPRATPEDIRWLLDHVNAFLREPLTTDDIIASWAGLRPLVGAPKEQEEETKDVSRRHLLVDDPGIVTITGGKLTAYRAMAELAGDAVVRQLGRGGRSTTRELRLDGCRPLPTPTQIGDVAAHLGIDRAGARHLLRRHGSNVPAIAALVARDPALAERLHPDRPYLAAEAVWAATHEQARDAEDILARRTRLTLEVRDPQAAAPAAEHALAAALAASPSSRV